MTTLSDVEKTLAAWFERLLFAQKVNTAVSGIGALAVVIFLSVQSMMLTTHHGIEMAEFRRITKPRSVPEPAPETKIEQKQAAPVSAQTPPTK